jgi:hypothetical protein
MTMPLAALHEADFPDRLGTEAPATSCPQASGLPSPRAG